MAFPVNEDCIAAEEAKLGRPLPPAWRARLARENGGELEILDRTTGDREVWSLHPVWDPTDRRRMARTANHIARQTAAAREWAGFPADAIALGEDGQGDILVLRAGVEEPEIWDHETRALHATEISWE